MIGAMLSKLRKDKGLTKSEIAKLIGIDIGHLTHIEKGERMPSIKTLKHICKACNIPYQPLLYAYDKDLSKNELRSIDNISYSKILAFDNISSFSNFIDCPSHKSSACMAVKITDNSMLDTFDLNSYAYIELNSPLANNDIGFFQCDGTFLIRKFHINKNTYTLKADNTEYPDIIVNTSNDFYIIGKVIR